MTMGQKITLPVSSQTLHSVTEAMPNFMRSVNPFGRRVHIHTDELDSLLEEDTDEARSGESDEELEADSNEELDEDSGEDDSESELEDEIDDDSVEESDDEDDVEEDEGDDADDEIDIGSHVGLSLDDEEVFGVIIEFDDGENTVTIKEDGTGDVVTGYQDDMFVE